MPKCSMPCNYQWPISKATFFDLAVCFSGAPTREQRARDRASYSWNIISLFSFGCHLIWPSVRTYASTDCTGGVGETVKRKRGDLTVLASPHLLYWTFTIWSIDSCQNRIATDQYPMTISRAHVSTHRGDVIYLEAVRWPVNSFTRSRSRFNLILSG